MFVCAVQVECEIGLDNTAYMHVSYELIKKSLLHIIIICYIISIIYRCGFIERKKESINY